MNPILSLARPEILALKAYESARSLCTEGSVFLDANESPLPPISFPGINRYPEPQPRALVQRFSQIYHVPSSNLLVGRGSDEAIDIIVRTFCESKKDSILICPPTYGMYQVSADIQGAAIVRVPLLKQDNDFTLDIENIIQAALGGLVKIIFLCSPNNPTGTLFDFDSINQICDRTKDRCLVVVDEAYSEFSKPGESVQPMSRIKLFPNLVILRTLSKAWALAGARCGAAIGEETLIALLQKVRAPYPLSTPTIQTALSAIGPAQQILLNQRVLGICSERERLRTTLLTMPNVKIIYPSEANFLLVQFTNSPQILQTLKSKGIIVRDRGKEPGLSGCIRITVGTTEENDLLLSTLQGELS